MRERFQRRGQRFARPLTGIVIAAALVGGCATPGRARLAEERAAHRRAAEVDAAIIARSLHEIDRYRAHLAAGFVEQRRKDKEIAALAAEVKRVHARCDALAAGRIATIADE